MSDTKMITCPSLGCGEEVGVNEFWKQKDHMERLHPDLIEERLRRAHLFSDRNAVIAKQRELMLAMDSVRKQYGGQELVDYEHRCGMLRMGTDKSVILRLITAHLGGSACTYCGEYDADNHSRLNSTRLKCCGDCNHPPDDSITSGLSETVKSTSDGLSESVESSNRKPEDDDKRIWTRENFGPGDLERSGYIDKDEEL